MANAIRIKRRVSGLSGAPAALKSAELAHNEVDDTVYIGKGDDGSGNATSVVAVAGVGTFVDKSSTQTISGAKTFSTVPKASEDASASNELIRKSQFDTGLSGKADASHSHIISDVTGLQTALDGKASSTHSHAISDVTGLQTALDGKASSTHTHVATDISDSTTAGRALLTATDAAEQRTALGLGTASTQSSTSFASATHSHVISDVTGLQTALDGKVGVDSPALTGTPTAPTASAGTNTTQIATTAFVASAVSALIDAAPGALDTLNELAAAIGDDANFVTTITNALAGKLAAASNLSDLTDAATARSNLGLGSMATQAASNVAITGGTIDGVTIDGGTF